MISQVATSKRSAKPAKPAPPQADAQPHGVIDTQAIYSLSAFKRAVGVGDWGMRAMRKNGLQVTQIGNLRFITGADFATFLSAVAERGGGSK